MIYVYVVTNVSSIQYVLYYYQNVMRVCLYGGYYAPFDAITYCLSCLSALSLLL